MKMRIVLAAGLFGVAFAGLANAVPTYTVSSTDATADFTFTDPNHFTITLTDLFAPTSLTAQELTGFSFVFTAAATTRSLTNVNPTGGVVNCSGDFNANSNCPAGTGTSPYDWSVGGTGTTFSLVLNQLHPYGIINSSYTTASSGSGNLLNSTHNPFLVGPVIYSITTTGFSVIPGVTSSTFLFGTTPTSETGGGSDGGGPPVGQQAPEPATPLLVGLALAALGFRRKLLRAA